MATRMQPTETTEETVQRQEQYQSISLAEIARRFREIQDRDKRRAEREKAKKQ